MVRLKVEPEDFVVEEIPLYAPSGEGGHTFLWIEKCDVNSERVARALARAAGVAPRDVGYAGRKDRRALARQWFSVPDLAPERALDLEIPGARVLEAVRHPHKLRTGHLAGNRFDLLVRDVDEEAVAAAPATAAVLRAEGFANRFGEQRFGREGDNAERGLALLRGETGARDRRSRREDRFLLSALQAQVFNRVLEERPLPLSHLELGDVALVRSSGGPFLVEDLEHEQPRADAFEIARPGRSSEVASP
jgi:tRNA pseudouridine13 synthase